MSDAGESDSERVAKTLRGDREAFVELYDRYARLVRAIAFRADRDLGACEDLTQESFLRAFRQLHTLRRPERFGAWIAGIARQVAREATRLSRPSSLVTDVANSNHLVDAIDTEDELAQLRYLVAQLPEEERVAVHAFFLNERNVKATSALINRSRSGTYEVLQRAVKRLAGWLKTSDAAEETKL